MPNLVDRLARIRQDLASHPHETWLDDQDLAWLLDVAEAAREYVATTGETEWLRLVRLLEGNDADKPERHA